jgi:hypothetical protein
MRALLPELASCPAKAKPTKNGTRARACPVCGSITRRPYCAEHDPNRAGRREGHIERQRIYRQNAGLA